MTRRLPPRLLRRLILSALLGVAIGVAAWYLGMDAAHAVGLGAAAFAFTACLSALGEAADVSWPVTAPPPRAGARRDVVQLGWSLGARGGRASPEGVRRLRTVAERALSLRGLDLEDRSADARLEELLGADAVRLLRRGSGVAPPRTSEVTAALGRLEALDPTVEPKPAAGRRGAGASTSHDAPVTASGQTPTATTSRFTTPNRPTTSVTTSNSRTISTPQEPPRAR